MAMHRYSHRLAVVAACLLLAVPARGHDTWLSAEAPTERGERRFTLGTGDSFPRRESALAMAQLATHGCEQPAATAEPGTPLAWPLRWWADAADALWLRTTRPVSPGLLLDCHVQTRPIAIELTPAQVQAYLDEARPDDAVRERWARQQAAGTPWREVFRKHARTLVGERPSTTPLALPATMALDTRLALPHWPLRAGDTVGVQLLADGRPLAHHRLELRGDTTPRGLWLQTDAEGRLALRLPLAGRWLLRGVQLQPAADGGEGWEGRFFSLLLDVGAAR